MGRRSIGLVLELTLLRHGESAWNAENRFTGWTDVDLSTEGEEEARRAGQLMREAGIEPTVVHTSVLTRAVRTANLALDEMGLAWLPVRRHWRLNERHYGALQGLNKLETAQRYGSEQVKEWRRSYAVPPPPLEPSDERHPVHDPRYREVLPEALPATECLKDVVGRMLPYYEDAIVPDLIRLRSVLVVAHGNSLRALVKHLDAISDSDVVELNIPTGVPRRYVLGDDLSVGEVAYLGDRADIERATESVARQAG